MQMPSWPCYLALKSLRHRLGVTGTVLFTLALAVGANVVTFALAAVMLLAPPAINNTERLGWVFGVDLRTGQDRARVSTADFIDFSARSRTFETLAARGSGTVTLTGRGPASRLTAMRVTANHFQVWGLTAVDGRTFLPEEDVPGAPPVVVLSHRLWSARLGSEAIVGKTITLNGESHLVVGVLTKQVEVGALSLVDVWLPLRIDRSRVHPRELRTLQLCGLLRPGVSAREASEEFHGIAMQLARDHPNTNANWDARVLGTWAARTGPQNVVQPRPSGEQLDSHPDHRLRQHRPPAGHCPGEPGS